MQHSWARGPVGNRWRWGISTKLIDFVPAAFSAARRTPRFAGFLSGRRPRARTEPIRPLRHRYQLRQARLPRRVEEMRRKLHTPTQRNALEPAVCARAGRNRPPSAHSVNRFLNSKNVVLRGGRKRGRRLKPTTSGGGFYSPAAISPTRPYRRWRPRYQPSARSSSAAPNSGHGTSVK
jgi:hypothetical protein